MTQLVYYATRARQSSEHQVLMLAATATEVLRFAEIERVGRDADGRLSGFQRPQIAGHIREIRDFLEKPDAVLPNAIVVAFTGEVDVEDLGNGQCRVTFDLEKGAKGLVVDGQQRLSALAGAARDDFQLFVSILICRDEAELRRQFVLINNTRPLPKSLIYELLPTVAGLPERLESRSLAADLTAELNWREFSSLKGQIYQHTNPGGVIRDTAIQKVLMNSLSDGVMRELVLEPSGRKKCLELVSAYFKAVQMVFPEAWYGHTPATSRLVHGAGIQALGYVMETLALLDGARSWSDFSTGLGCLVGRTAWTSGAWDFGGGDVRSWKEIQNTSRDASKLAKYLDSIVRRDLRVRRSGAPGSAPLLDVMLEPTGS